MTVNLLIFRPNASKLFGWRFTVQMDMLRKAVLEGKEVYGYAMAKSTTWPTFAFYLLKAKRKGKFYGRKRFMDLTVSDIDGVYKWRYTRTRCVRKVPGLVSQKTYFKSKSTNRVFPVKIIFLMSTSGRTLQAFTVVSAKLKSSTYSKRFPLMTPLRLGKRGGKMHHIKPSWVRRDSQEVSDAQAIVAVKQPRVALAQLAACHTVNQSNPAGSCRLPVWPTPKGKLVAWL